MPLPIIDDTFRMTINYAPEAGVTAHNVIHWRSMAAGTEGQLVAAFEAHADGGLITPVSDGVVIESYDVIRLDGSSATVSIGATEVIGGSGTGDILPASAAVLSLHTAVRGPAGRGRIFLGPTTEGQTANGLWSNQIGRSNLAEAWFDFVNLMVADDWELGVASYKNEFFGPVTSYSVRAQVGTLRRRQEQLL